MLTIFAIALLLWCVVLIVHGVNARSADHVVAASNDIVHEALMANEVSTVMNYLDDATLALLGGRFVLLCVTPYF